MKGPQQARARLSGVLLDGAREQERLIQAHVRVLKDPLASPTAKEAARAMLEAGRRHQAELRRQKSSWQYAF